MRASNQHTKLLKLLAYGAAAALLALAPTAASAGKFKVIHSFCAKRDCTDGYFPTAPVVMDRSGNFFGTTSARTAYELENVGDGTYNFKTIFDFSSTPNNGGLVVDTAGNLYGFAGQFFKLSYGFGSHHNKWNLTAQEISCSQENCGTAPVGTLTYAGQSSGTPYDGSSALYGVMQGGGTNNTGLVYQLTPNGGNSWTETVLYNFCSEGGNTCADGAFPAGGVMLDSSGNLYGTTTIGGAGPNAGIVYRLSNQGGEWTESILYNFCAQKRCSDGNYPVGSLTFDASGNLFGTTNFGGKNNCNQGCGVLYELSPAGGDWQEVVLHAFCAKSDCADGSKPIGPPVVASNGGLFGTTQYGGGNDIDDSRNGGGVAYQYENNTYKVLHSFCALPSCADGEYPNGNLSQDTYGKLIGTALDGGKFGDQEEGGVVFSVAP
jgi:uncharacterized repeat protein (TIGR03803 family)